MIRWFWAKILKWGWDYKFNSVVRGQDSLAVASPGGDLDIEGLRFVVMPANGGTIVQIKHYDRKSDRNDTVTHIITDDEDVAVRVGHIVSLELLRSK